MAIVLADLLARVAQLRPDVKPGKIMFYVQEAARGVARKTYLVQNVSTFTVGASSVSTPVTIPASEKFLMTINVTRTDLTDGREKNLYPYNDLAIRSRYTDPNASPGTPTGYEMSNDGEITLYPKPLDPTQISVHYALSPNGDFETIDMPEEATEAIVAYARADALMYPGPGADVKAALYWERIGNMEISALRAIALLGRSGSVCAQGNTFRSNSNIRSLPDGSVV